MGLPSGRIEEDFIVSRFQFARPAVVLSFLDQMIFMPPVEAASKETWLFVMVASSSARKEVARACFFSEKAFFASFTKRPCLTRLFLVGEKRRTPSETSLSSSGSNFDLGFGVFLGEYSSFQSLMTSCSQKLSMLGR